jgi:hypothetical protein
MSNEEYEPPHVPDRDGEQQNDPFQAVAALFAAAGEQAEHAVDEMRRILAAIVKKVGPVMISQVDFDEAPVQDLIVFQAVDDDDPEGTTRMGWALPEHIDNTGDKVQLHTSEALVAQVIGDGLDDGLDEDRVAAEVVKALGLPVREEG